MTDTDPLPESRIERHIDQMLDDADEARFPLVRDVLYESPDRWYGQLVVAVYDSLAERQNHEAVLPAAAAIEFLRGYVRLRNQLLVALTEKHAHSFTRDTTPALLAGDYLYTAAFSLLGSVPDSPSGDRFEILTTTLETITDRFARTYIPAESASCDQVGFFDDTVGSLGRGAAVLGSTLAGFDESARRHYERLGHGLSTARQIGHVLDGESNCAMVVPPTFDESKFRMYEKQRRNDAEQALNTLSETGDVTRLRAFAETTVPNPAHRS